MNGLLKARKLFFGVALFAFASAMTPTLATAAAAGITFQLDMYTSCIGGSAAPSAVLTFDWRDSTGLRKVKKSISTSATGTWEYCSRDPDVWVAQNDKIKVSDGSSSRNYTVPNVTMNLDRATGIATGTGPAARTIRLCSVWGYFNDWEHCYSVRIGTDGTWKYDSGMGGFFRVDVQLRWKSPKGDRIGIYEHAPFADLTVGKSTVSGYALPRAKVVLHAGRTSTARTTADEHGRFTAVFRTASGHARAIRVGDHIFSKSFASDEDWIVPLTEASVDVDTDVVAGTCHQAVLTSELVRIDVRRNSKDKGSAFGTTESDGTFSINMQDPDSFGDIVDIRSGDKVIVNCYQESGDLIAQSFLVP